MSDGTPLRDLQAEIRSCRWDNGEITQMLWFIWRGQHHGIPYSDTRVSIDGRHVWKLICGSTVDDLSLSPSYHCREPETHRLHCYIRDGRLIPC